MNTKEIYLHIKMILKISYLKQDNIFMFLEDVKYLRWRLEGNIKKMERIRNLLNIEKMWIICLSSIYLFTGLCIYEVLIFYGMRNYFFFIPIVLWICVMFGKKIFRFNMSERLSIIAIILTYFILCIISNFNIIYQFYIQNYFTIFALLTGVFFISILILKNNAHIKEKSEYSINFNKEDLFNLFYINVSKVHEIAMLIDNKIMKTVEREQISEELLRTTSNISAKTNILSGDISTITEDNYKKRVYENFDVKTTKSIMLRKLYDVAKNGNKTIKNLSPGQLILFKDVELERRNIDDTVMILNVLRESKLKNQSNDNIEINMNKMMEKMLDDFTIDYQFEQSVLGDETKCLIQLPYKTNENFENGYQHNDLQLGRLSVIGIYRGKIDFSKRESVSSRFLDLIIDSYKRETAPIGDDTMKESFVIKEQQKLPFDFRPNKLSDEMHLIDVIAIIQELNINKE